MSSLSVSFLGGGILLVVMVKVERFDNIDIWRDMGTQFLDSYLLFPKISSVDASRAAMTQYRYHLTFLGSELA